jgi:hypothetical protein
LELRFVLPQLGRLDELDAELLFAAVFDDERPPHGVAGLCDWRLGGRVARLLEDGFFTGALGDVLLLPGRPKTTFDKICLFGAGSRERFDEEVLTAVVRAMLTTMVGLRARGGVVELPGRDTRRVAPERAAEIVLEEAAHHPGEIDVWVLVEELGARASIEKLVFDLKRRRQRIEEPLEPL